MIIEDLNSRVKRIFDRDVKSAGASGRFSHQPGALGSSYAKSVEKVPYSKNIGIRTLLSLIPAVHTDLVLDVLGGTGQVALAARDFQLWPQAATIVTADAEADQIERARASGLPATILDLTNTNHIASGSVDHVLIAYGFHHIDPQLRLGVIKEMARIIRYCGYLILYEGPQGSSTERISTVVVDALSMIPHQFTHPTSQDLLSYITQSGLNPVRVVRILDPQVFIGESIDQVEDLACRYYIQHYSLPSSLTWPDLRNTLLDAYSRSMPLNEELYMPGNWAGLTSNFLISALTPELLAALFPAGAPARYESAQYAAVLPREGLAVVASHST